MENTLRGLSKTIQGSEAKGKLNQIQIFNFQLQIKLDYNDFVLIKKLCIKICPIYIRNGSSVWDELGQRAIVRLIIRLRINKGKQTDHPSSRTIWIIRVHRRITEDNSSERIIHSFISFIFLFAIYSIFCSNFV